MQPKQEALNDEYNPKGEYWEGQKAAVISLFSAMHNGYKYLCLNAPTGTGKSIINATVANLSGRAHILTTQKKLQEQYLELGDNFTRVLGRNNFTCLSNKRALCDKGLCITEDDFKCPYRPNHYGRYDAFAGKKWAFTDDKQKCPYWHNVDLAWNSQHIVFNYAYYMLKMSSPYNDFEDADIQIMDEGHNVESYIRNVATFKITNRSLASVRYVENVDVRTYDVNKIPQIQNINDAIHWLKHLLDVIESRIIDTNNNINYPQMQDRLNKLTNMQGRIRMVVNRYEKNPINWIYIKVPEGFELIPMHIGDYARESLFQFADHHLFSSATLPPKDVFCKRFGLNPDEVFYYTMESPFDVEKAPIYVYPQPIMKYGPDIDDRRAQMGSSIAAVLREHPDEKGLILCNSYKEVDVYDEYLRTKHPEQWNRVIRQEKGDNIEDLMEQHIGHENSIIMSPSLWEGLDLRGELGTFLIVAKIPYPEYTNPIVQGLKNLDNNRYFEDTVLKIRQGVGRVIRSREDHAKIYILDGAFKTIYRYNRKQFPQEFIDRVIYVR